MEINKEIQKSYPQIKYFLLTDKDCCYKLGNKSDSYHVATQINSTKEEAHASLLNDFLEVIGNKLKTGETCIIWRSKPEIKCELLHPKIYTMIARYILINLVLPKSSKLP